MGRIAKSAGHDLAPNLYKMSEAEIDRKLGRYGIYADHAWIDADQLPGLSGKECIRGRPCIEAAIQQKQEAGLLPLKRLV